MSRSINGQQKIIVAMSGGVDSSVAALLLLRAGYDVIGATMDTGYGHASEQAAQICTQLGIKHYVVDVRQAFHEQIVLSFAAAYAQGRTPNPCVCCNAALKFPVFEPLMRDEQAAYLATGHYIRISEDNGRQLLFCGDDAAKDQSYFLYRLKQDTLRRCLFPLGGYTKQQVRTAAAQYGLASAAQKDSYDVCFIPDGDYRQLLRKLTPQAFVPGEIVDEQGRVVGQHQGLAAYTLGQRRGVEVALGYPVYVLQLDLERNRLVVGAKERLCSSEARMEKCNFLPFDQLERPLRVEAKVRYKAAAKPAWLYPDECGAKVVFDTPEWGITPGQSLVCYDGGLLIGGGEIC